MKINTALLKVVCVCAIISIKFSFYVLPNQLKKFINYRKNTSKMCLYLVTVCFIIHYHSGDVKLHMQGVPTILRQLYLN